MLEENDRVVLTDDAADPGPKAGDVGTIVHVHRGGEAFEVEFLSLVGHTAGAGHGVVVAEQHRRNECRDGKCTGRGTRCK
ncbi:MAG: DUF4926 domain-containing protein [Acidobacteria bacterium]|nr:DUF4926 domain-containing protein [Acidobacteriota bacterium]